MDVTGSTVAGGLEEVCQLNTTYVSCVKVDGVPILPPLMTEKKREEMRRYRDMAIHREKQLNEKKGVINQTVIISRKSPSPPESFAEQLKNLSTTDPSRLKESRPNSPLSTGIPMTSTPRVVKVQARPEIISNRATSPEDVQSQCDSDVLSDDQFASAASSSAGTFVIRRSTGNGGAQTPDKPEIIEGYLSTSEDERDHQGKQEAPQTVLRKSGGEDHLFKRKRPAKYFDIDDELDQSKCSSYSLPNQVPTQHYLPEMCKSADSSNFSPVPVTNFATLAKSLTMEFTKKFCSSNPATASPPKGTYDNVQLSKDIPSSAEKGKEDDAVSNSSDKENLNSGGITKHVRKLSYTVATPSAALLEAVSNAKILEPLVSEAGSVGTGSNYQTPEKASASKKIYFPEENDQTCLQQGAGENPLQIIEQDGKQAHLERFLVDMDNLGGSFEPYKVGSPCNILDLGGMQAMLKKMQEKHEAELKLLAEKHRQQELLIKQEFESEMEKLKDQFSSTLNTTDSSKSSKLSPPSFRSGVLSGRSPPRGGSLSENKSEALPASLFEDTTSKDSHVFQFTGGSGRSTAVASGNQQGPSTDLTGVGLSKLHSRMHLMSPRIFKTSVDGRSPLLKGLVFLDPLTKPAAPLRIPQKAFDPSMKRKFDRVSAAVKGFLIRRLLNTEKVQNIVQTIRDTVDLLLKLYDEGTPTGSAPFSKSEDNALHQRLIQQLTGACRSFHDVFFKLSTKERMAIISTDREKLRAKALRSLASPAKPNISNATLKSIERRMSHRASPIKRENRRQRTSKAFDPVQSSQSVKPKPIKSFNISPKRRRMSYFDEIGPKSGPVSGRQDFNGNSYKSSSSRDQSSSMSRTALNATRSVQQMPLFSGMSETFVVPSANSSLRNTKPNTSGVLVSRESSGNKNLSARSSQSATSMVSSSTSGANRSRASISRQPWNSSRR